MSDVKPVTKLRAVALTGQTYRAALANVQPMAKAMLVPWLLTVALAQFVLILAGDDALQLGEPSVGESPVWPVLNIIGGLASWYFMMAYAVTCHRIILVGPSDRPSFFGIGFSKREWRFIGYTFAVTLIPMLPMMIIGGVAVMAASGAHNTSAIYLILLAPLYLFVVMMTLRFLITLPMVAVDGPPGLRANLAIAWNLMKGSTFALFMAFILVNLPFIILFALLIGVSVAISFFGATLFPLMAINHLGNFVSIALTATLLSTAFRTLTGFDTPAPDHDDKQYSDLS